MLQHFSDGLPTYLHRNQDTAKDVIRIPSYQDCVVQEVIPILGEAVGDTDYLYRGVDGLTARLFVVEGAMESNVNLREGGQAHDCVGFERNACGLVLIYKLELRSCELALGDVTLDSFDKAGAHLVPNARAVVGYSSIR